MACIVNSGISLGCSDSLGGIKEVYIMGTSGATEPTLSYTQDGDEVVTGLTADVSATFYKFAVKRNTSSLTQTITKSFEAGTIYYQQDLVLSFYKYDQDKRNLVKLMGFNDNLKVVVVDQNDTAYYLGIVNGMFLQAGTTESGLAVGDKNGFSLTLQAQEPLPAPTGPIADLSLTNVVFES
jgi:hypothetical protein